MTAKRPIAVLLTSHWISMLGVALVTLAGVSWLFVLPAHLRGHVENPYIGVLIFVIIPIIFVLGLVLIPVGIALGKRQAAAVIDNTAAIRKLAIFFLVTTGLNIVIGGQATYKAVEHMETGQFCGATCHVMNPELAAHQVDVHKQLNCVECHVGPGATGWFASKIAGTRQLAAVMMNSFHRPIESAMEKERLTPSADTCEKCHSRTTASPNRLRVITRYTENEANTRAFTAFMMQVSAIHKAHMGPGVTIRYAAEDAKRQTIPWVEITRPDGKTAFGDAKNFKTFTMECVDCHNRPAHPFERPADAIDTALARGEINPAQPWVKKKSMELLQATYANEAEASSKIHAAIDQKTADVLVAIWKRNVFPDLKVTWGTYANNLGHTGDPGCFRCHDGRASGPRQISQDCTVCHQPLAMDEESPDALKPLGVLDNPSAYLKK